MLEKLKLVIGCTSTHPGLFLQPLVGPNKNMIKKWGLHDLGEQNFTRKHPRPRPVAGACQGHGHEAGHTGCTRRTQDGATGLLLHFGGRAPQSLPVFLVEKKRKIQKLPTLPIKNAEKWLPKLERWPKMPRTLESQAMKTCLVWVPVGATKAEAAIKAAAPVAAQEILDMAGIFVYLRTVQPEFDAGQMRNTNIYRSKF